MNDLTIIFEPEGKKLKASFGATLLKIAEEAGVGVRSECGGRGLCGKCRVIVTNRSAVNELTEAERKHLSQLEIDEGYRLACQARILKSVAIMIPPESRVGPRRIEVVGMERDVKLSPLVKKIYLSLPRPTISDIKPDLERLLEALHKQLKCLPDLEVDYELLKKLAGYASKR